MKGFLRFHHRIALQGAETPLERLTFLLLLPLSVAYGCLVWLRNKCYDLNLIPSYRAGIPVVSVGNLAVGGTGKTPMVDWLVKEFLQQGNKPAVISRGYGGSFTGKVGIVSDGEELLMAPQQAGDEPCLLARRNPEALVLVARKRADGIRAAVEKLAADIIILDDGFQHRGVQRDLDLVLLDGKRPFANNWPLPAGLLREFKSALQRAGMLILTRATEGSTALLPAMKTFRSCHKLDDVAADLRGQCVPLAQLKGKKFFAFAGIADPNGFFNALKAEGLQIVETLPLDDHCRYDRLHLHMIETGANGFDALITTEKDAVKLAPDMFDLPCYQVPMRIQIENEEVFRAELHQQIRSQ